MASIIRTEPQENQHDASTRNNANGGILSGATESLATAGETAKQGVVHTLQNLGVMGQGNSTLPSQETRFSGSRGGVGTLPGRPSEPSVAKLPEEKKLEEEVGHPLGREGVLNTQAEDRQIGLAESLVLDQKNRVQNPTADTSTAAKFINLDAVPTPDETPGGEHDVDLNKPLPPSENDKSYSEDQAKRRAAKTVPPGHSSKDDARTEHIEHAEQKNAKDQHDLASTQASPKVSLGQKVKGEIKALSGKLANNPDKVEAGQALKKGTTA